MSALRTALLDRGLARATRVAVSGIAVFLALRFTDGFLMGLGVAVVLATVLDTPWWLYNRYANTNNK
jgi:Sec-independent protein secretion pathway component TatC